MEYESRLSQYSEWFLSIVAGPRSTEGQLFQSCVSPTLLRHSIKVLSGKPNFTNTKAPQQFVPCKSHPQFQALFGEYSDRSTLGILAEIRLINAKLFPVTWKIDPKDGARVPDKNAEAYRFRGHVLNAINNFLNPDAILSRKITTLNGYTVEQFRNAFTDSFYGIGFRELWYGDVFAG